MKNIFLLSFFIVSVYGCSQGNQDINDANKRNDDWAWWIDDASGKGEW